MIAKNKLLRQNAPTLWQKIIPIIQNNQNFIITAHVNPDCDALGSELALAEHLQSLGKRVTIINSDLAPENFRFLDPKRKLRRFTPKKHASVIKQAQVIVVLDASGGWNRLGPVGETLQKADAIKICIDHHPDATDFVDTAVIDTDAAATGELIFELIQAMSGYLSAQMAQALYAAIITDTGSFRYPKTSPRTHRITAALLEAGIDPLLIYTQIYEQNSLGLVRLKGHALDAIQTACQGQIAYYGLTRSTLKAYGVDVSELDGFASLGQQIGGVRVTVFCTEAAKGRVKISLRSDGSIAINGIVQNYGGGGHPSAAGAIVKGQLEAVIAQIVEQVAALL